MKICHCNNCGNNYEDSNPDNKSIDYPDTTPTAGHLAQLFEELNNPESIYWGCPKCCTDGFLVDTIPEVKSAEKKAFIVDFMIAFRVIATSGEEAQEIAYKQLPDGVIGHVNIPSVEEDANNPYDEDIDEETDEIPEESQEIIMFHLEDDNECYYCFYEAEMIDFADNQCKEVESWGIATNGLPDGALRINEKENIYINYGIR